MIISLSLTGEGDMAAINGTNLKIELSIGSGYRFIKKHVRNALVFNRSLTDDEIEKIRAAIYSIEIHKPTQEKGPEMIDIGSWALNISDEHMEISFRSLGEWPTEWTSIVRVHSLLVSIC